MYKLFVCLDNNASIAVLNGITVPPNVGNHGIKSFMGIPYLDITTDFWSDEGLEQQFTEIIPRTIKFQILKVLTRGEYLIDDEPIRNEDGIAYNAFVM
jgi:hypothetical protein